MAANRSRINLAYKGVKMSKNHDLSNVDVVLYALYKLGGALKNIHTEHIAWESFNLSEDRFAWILPEFRARKFPDKTTVRYALESAKKIKLVKGRAGRDRNKSEGWQLTSLGTEWILKNKEKIALLLRDELPLSEAIPSHQAERFIKKIKAEKIFQDFRRDKGLESATPYDFSDLLSCSPDASSKVIKQKFDLLKSTAILINNDEIRTFLSACENKYSKLMEVKLED